MLLVSVFLQNHIWGVFGFTVGDLLGHFLTVRGRLKQPSCVFFRETWALEFAVKKVTLQSGNVYLFLGPEAP